MRPKVYGAELWIRDNCLVGEGPVVDGLHDALYWVDIPAGRLRTSSIASRDARTVAEIGCDLGAGSPRSDGRGFAVAYADGFGFLLSLDEPAPARVEATAPFLSDPGLRMNDAKCDAAGRMWGGSTARGFDRGRGGLHSWTGADQVSTALTGLTLPNGIGWSPESRVMYLVDSMDRTILQGRFDLDRGTVENWGIFVDCRSTDGVPDGLAVDMDGCVWVAQWDAAEVNRFDDRGRLVGRVDMPVSRPSSCAFLADGTMVVTTAAEDTDPAAEPLAGSLFLVDCGVAGVPVSPFLVTS